VRPDLQEIHDRHDILTDAARLKHDPKFERKVARRHQAGLRTARENVADLVDEGTFIEYGALRVAGQRMRRTMDDLIHHTPGDGIITGIGCINASTFPKAVARAGESPSPLLLLLPPPTKQQ